MKCKDCNHTVIDPETGSLVCTEKAERVNGDDECDRIKTDRTVM